MVYQTVWLGRLSEVTRQAKARKIRSYYCRLLLSLFCGVQWKLGKAPLRLTETARSLPSSFLRVVRYTVFPLRVEALTDCIRTVDFIDESLTAGDDAKPIVQYAMRWVQCFFHPRNDAGLMIRRNSCNSPLELKTEYSNQWVVNRILHHQVGDTIDRIIRRDRCISIVPN